MKIDYSKELEILEDFAPKEKWKLIETKEGKSKDSYIAVSEKRKVFLKYDVDGSILKVLEDLGIAPNLLNVRELDGRRYIIQSYVNGSHPKKEWVVDNLSKLGGFFKKLHDDKDLLSKLVKPNIKNTTDHVNEELEKRRSWILDNISKADQSGFIQRLDLLEDASGKLEKCSLVVVHADPNLTNFILKEDGFYVIDWDDILLSDEMKDISMFLTHSFVPRGKWKIFFETYGIEFKQDEQVRFYWWLAFGELSIAYWAAIAGYKNDVSKYMNQFDKTYQDLKRYL